MVAFMSTWWPPEEEEAPVAVREYNICGTSSHKIRCGFGAVRYQDENIIVEMCRSVLQPPTE